MRRPVPLSGISSPSLIEEAPMAKNLYCPNCGNEVGNCGHVAGGLTAPSTLSGTCGKCRQPFSVTCQGDCL
jgi:hypothetical protein